MTPYNFSRMGHKQRMLAGLGTLGFVNIGANSSLLPSNSGLLTKDIKTGATTNFTALSMTGKSPTGVSAMAAGAKTLTVDTRAAAAANATPSVPNMGVTSLSKGGGISTFSQTGSGWTALTPPKTPTTPMALPKTLSPITPLVPRVKFLPPATTGVTGVTKSGGSLYDKVKNIASGGNLPAVPPLPPPPPPEFRTGTKPPPPPPTAAPPLSYDARNDPVVPMGTGDGSVVLTPAPALPSTGFQPSTGLIIGGLFGVAVLGYFLLRR